MVAALLFVCLSSGSGRSPFYVTSPVPDSSLPSCFLATKLQPQVQGSLSLPFACF